MILEYKSIDLFGKKLFTWTTLQTPLRIAGIMAEKEACFAYVLEGESQAYSEKEALSAQAHEALLSKCGNFVTKLISGSKNGLYSTITVHFHEEVIKKVYADSLPQFLKQRTGNESPNMIKVEASGLVRQYMENVRSYFQAPDLISDELLILKLKEIILLLIQTKNSPLMLEMMQNLFCRRTYNFKEIIEAHLFSDISLAELASLTSHSLSAFKREFSRIYTDTPASYIIKKRVERVAEVLLVSDDPVSHIAYDCGFKNPAHLSKVFKLKYGVSPSEYRSQLVKR